MEWRPILKTIWVWVSFAYGLFMFFLYGLKAFFKGAFFRLPTEKENLELLLARDRFWHLSKKWSGLTHCFLTLRNGFKFHYVANYAPESGEATRSNEPLVIFIHGFPDSWAIWRHLLTSVTLRERSTMIAVDLPGYGGSDSLHHYGATEVLEALAEFLVAIREQYGVDTNNAEEPARKVVVVGHDWGALLGFRLAAEAPQLADRFILTNGPLVPLVKTNIVMALESAAKMSKTFLKKPLLSGSILIKSICTLKPLLRQLRLSGYIFVFQLPVPMVSYLGRGANYVYLKTIHQLAAGVTGEFTVRDAQESMASTLGPGELECRTSTEDGRQQYPESVHKRHAKGNFADLTAYYRHGAALETWNKSLETISALHAIRPNQPRRTSSGTGVFDAVRGSLQANATVLWGATDLALDSHLMLEGISDYLVHGSQVITLPRTGHFTPMEVEGRAALEEALKWTIAGERTDVGSDVGAVYRGTTVLVRK